MSRSAITLLVSASGLSLLSANAVVAHAVGRTAALVPPGPLLDVVETAAAVLWLVYAVVRAAERICRTIDTATRDALTRRYAESVGVDLPHRSLVSNGHLRRVW